MNNAIPAREGYIPFRGYHTWYRSVGETQPGRLPLLALHGGPGAPHDYLESLEGLAATGRQVIFYDQLGCGNSDQPHDPSLWTVELFVAEVAAVRAALGLEMVHLLGQSWGGMLAMCYALTRPVGVASLTLASTGPSVPLWVAEAGRLRAELPDAVRQTLERHEADGTLDAPAYLEATATFYRRHLCRIYPYPDPVQRSFDKLDANPEVYHTMWGPNEFLATGTLRTWDISGRLGEIDVPTLITCGRYDEATPAIAAALQRGIAGSEVAIFERSAHMAHLEEATRYNEVLAGFLDRVERQG